MSEMIYNRGANSATDSRTVQKSSLPFVVIAAQFLVTTLFLFVLVLNHVHITLDANYRGEFAQLVASPPDLKVPAFMFPFAQALVGVFKNTRAHNYKQVAIPSHCDILLRNDGAIADSYGSLNHLGRHRDTYPYASLAVFFSVIQSFCTTQTLPPKIQSFFRPISVNWFVTPFVFTGAVIRYAFVHPAPALVGPAAVIGAAFIAAGTSLSQEMFVFVFCLGIGGFAWHQADLHRRVRNLCDGMLQYLPNYGIAPPTIFASYAGVHTIDDLLGLYVELTKVCELSGVDMVPIGLEDVVDKPVAFTTCIKYIMNTPATDISAMPANVTENAMQAIRVARIGELEHYDYGLFAQLKEGVEADGIKFVSKRQAAIETMFSCQTVYNAALVYVDENACYRPNIIAGNVHFANPAHRAAMLGLALPAASSRRYPSPGGAVQFCGEFVTRDLKNEIARKVATDLMAKRKTDHNIETDY